MSNRMISAKDSLFTDCPSHADDLPIPQRVLRLSAVVCALADKDRTFVVSDEQRQAWITYAKAILYEALRVVKQYHPHDYLPTLRELERAQAYYDTEYSTLALNRVTNHALDVMYMDLLPCLLYTDNVPYDFWYYICAAERT